MSWTYYLLSMTDWQSWVDQVTKEGVNWGYMASNYTKCKKCNKLVGHVDGNKICGCEPMSKKK